MHITVFGGSGKTGRILIDKALRAGHEVAAYVRDASRLGAPRERLEVLVGGLDDAVAIASAIGAADAVISVLGPDAEVRGRPLVIGTENIVSAMRDHGVRRLVAIATPSYHDPRDGFAFSVWLAVSLVHLVLPAAYSNVAGLGAVVAASELDWTLARIPLLSDAPGSGPARLGYPGQPGIGMALLPRETLAEFLLEAATRRDLVREAPMVCPSKRG